MNPMRFPLEGARRFVFSLTGALGVVALVGCSAYEPFDSVAHLREQYAERLGSEAAQEVEIPYELDEDLLEVVERIGPAGDEKRRVERIVDFIFGPLDLQYSLTPTRSAVETFRARQGNCLSFVNLFVGIARELRLNPFYVEVEDHQRWNYRDGAVVSQGHIVAGMYIDGELSTFDFLPYRPKAYRDFEPIDDLMASAHYYNNLGAEALMAGDLARAEELLELATSLAPEFDKAVNNLGLYYLRRGETERAIRVLDRGLEIDPDNVPLLTNLARAHQLRGDTQRATELLDRVEGVRHTNPFFYVYRAELALARGDTTQALRHMREALRQDTEIPEVHVGFVKVYLALGDLEKARHHLGRALTLDATHAEARRYAVMLERMSPGIESRD